VGTGAPPLAVVVARGAVACDAAEAVAVAEVVVGFDGPAGRAAAPQPASSTAPRMTPRTVSGQRR
jgi:hypothetical protein